MKKLNSILHIVAGMTLLLPLLWGCKAVKPELLS